MIPLVVDYPPLSVHGSGPPAGGACVPGPFFSDKRPDHPATALARRLIAAGAEAQQIRLRILRAWGSDAVEALTLVRDHETIQRCCRVRVVQVPRPVIKSSRLKLPVAVAELVRAVADEHGLPPQLLVGPARSRAAVAARHEAICAIKDAMPYLSSTKIGQWFGNRDHTTILHALKRGGYYDRAFQHRRTGRPEGGGDAV